MNIFNRLKIFNDIKQVENFNLHKITKLRYTPYNRHQIYCAHISIFPIRKKENLVINENVHHEKKSFRVSILKKERNDNSMK